jgi:cbb3-type cytochrome oxidase maturation protein
MVILIILIPMSVVLALLAAGVFLFMNRQGQFDDLESPAYSVIADDDSFHSAEQDSPPA